MPKLILPLLLILCVPSGCGKQLTEIDKMKSRAHQGHVGAQYALGDMYRKGRGVPEDDKEAMK